MLPTGYRPNDVGVLSRFVDATERQKMNSLAWVVRRLLKSTSKEWLLISDKFANEVHVASKLPTIFFFPLRLGALDPI